MRDLLRNHGRLHEPARPRPRRASSTPSAASPRPASTSRTAGSRGGRGSRTGSSAASSAGSSPRGRSPSSRRPTCSACSRRPRRASLVWTYLFGVLWGIGGLTFGLTMRYLGIALGMAMALGYCAAFGTLMPPLFRGELEGVARTTAGAIVLSGVLVCLAGIVVSGLAGPLEGAGADRRAEAGRHPRVQLRQGGARRHGRRRPQRRACRTGSRPASRSPTSRSGTGATRSGRTSRSWSSSWPAGSRPTSSGASS